MRRNLIRAVLGGALVVGVPVAVLSTSEDFREAASVMDEYQTLLGVQAYLEANSEKLKKYASYNNEALARNAGAVNKILRELIEEMEKAKGAADSISEGDIRFHPYVFDELKISLDLFIRNLSPSNAKVSRLNQEAKNIKDKRNDWVFNWLASRKGIQTEEVVHMTQLVSKLRSELVDLNRSVSRLERSKIEDCSSNFYIDLAVKGKFGANNCEYSQTPFCRALDNRNLSGDMDTSQLTKVQAAALQRKMIYYEYLKKGGDDGAFGRMSKKAYSKYKKSSVFPRDLEKCEEKEKEETP